MKEITFKIEGSFCKNWYCNWECGGCGNCGCHCTCDD